MSGVAIKLMFMDAILKAAINEPDNRTMIERMLNIIQSGIVNVTNTGTKADATSLYFDIQFNSILPDDLKEAAEIARNLKEAGLSSTRTLVEYLGMNEDVDGELAAIKEDAVVVEPVV